ncbi:MAG: RsmB/NOP family class I SAM-dependent RNA methyltransferase, partial [Pseudomonadota bacterium]
GCAAGSLRLRFLKTASPKSRPGLAAREAAIDHLSAVLEKGRMFDGVHAAGSPAERAEARALADLVLRRLGQIDALIEEFVQRQPKGRGLQLLRLMTAELVFHGTPAHAAVDNCVRLARATKGTSRLAGLINAVGRRLAERGAGLAADQDAETLCMPKWLAKRLTADWGQKATRAIAAAHLAPPPHDLTLAQATDAAVLATELRAELLPTGSLRLPDRPQISALPGYDQGAWWVQDAAAALPVRLLGDVRDAKVLDLCAAPGGKTLQLATAGARVLAVDLSEPRAERLAQNLDRTGLDARMDVADVMEWEPPEVPDAIVLDAPCSATGTIRRHPDLAHRTDGRGLQALVDLQARMLDRAYSWLRPGGRLVFCTCSLMKAEGEDQLSAILARSGDAEVVAADPEALGVPRSWVSPEGALRTRPDYWQERGGLDGFFAVCLRKQ